MLLRWVPNLLGGDGGRVRTPEAVALGGDGGRVRKPEAVARSSGIGGNDSGGEALGLSSRLASNSPLSGREGSAESCGAFCLASASQLRRRASSGSVRSGVRMPIGRSNGRSWSGGCGGGVRVAADRSSGRGGGCGLNPAVPGLGASLKPDAEVLDVAGTRDEPVQTREGRSSVTEVRWCCGGTRWPRLTFWPGSWSNVRTGESTVLWVLFQVDSLRSGVPCRDADTNKMSACGESSTFV